MLESLVYRLLPEDATRLAALRAGDVDVVDRVGPEDLANLGSDSNYKTFSGETGGAPWILCLNTQKAPTSELAVRQAMMMAFDQAAIVDLLFKGTLTPAYNLLEPTMLGYDESTKDLFTVDVEGAKQLLEANGWTGDGIRSKDGQPLAVELYIVANFGMDDMSAAFQSQMQAIGLDVKITSLEFAAWWSAINAGPEAPNGANWTFYWWADPSGPFTAFFSEAGMGIGNGSQYSNPEVETLLANALATGDDTSRADFYNQAVRKVIVDVAGLPAFHKRLVLAAKSSVDMESLHTNAEGYPNFYDVGFLS
jgi:peptide/nickel transport system substrate-binding protein